MVSWMQTTIETTEFIRVTHHTLSCCKEKAKESGMDQFFINLKRLCPAGANLKSPGCTGESPVFQPARDWAAWICLLRQARGPAVVSVIFKKVIVLLLQINWCKKGLFYCLSFQSKTCDNLWLYFVLYNFIILSTFSTRYYFFVGIEYLQWKYDKKCIMTIAITALLQKH